MKTTAEPRPLTERQAEVVRWIAHHLEKHRRPPTLRWLMDQTGIRSLNGITYHLERLAAKGWLTRAAKAACAVLTGARLRPTGRPALEILDTPAGWALADVLVGSYTLGEVP